MFSSVENKEEAVVRLLFWFDQLVVSGAPIIVCLGYSYCFFDLLVVPNHVYRNCTEIIEGKSFSDHSY